MYKSLSTLCIYRKKHAEKDSLHHSAEYATRPRFFATLAPWRVVKKPFLELDKFISITKFTERPQISGAKSNGAWFYSLHS